jgi:tetratricopeptide (TPR) repeat protein
MLAISGLLISIVLHASPAEQQQAPPSSSARGAIAEAADALGQKDNGKALAAADRAIAQAPADGDAHLFRCRALAGLRRHEEAIAACTEAVRLKPDNPDALRDRGHYYLNLGRIEPGLTDLKRAESLTKSDRGIYYHLGMAYYLRGDFASAATAFGACSKNSSDDGAKIECQAWQYPSLRRAGREEEARRLLGSITARSLAGHPGNYLDRLLLFTGARSEQAVADTMSVEGALSETTVGYSLGLWHLLQGRPGQARAYFQRVLATGYTTSWGYRAAASDVKRLR